MNKAGLLTTTAASFALAVQANAQEIINTPSFTAQTERILSQACPDSTPSGPAAIKQCTDAIWPRAHDLAANLSTFIKDYKWPLLSAGIAQGELLPCQHAVQSMKATPFSTAYSKAYTQKAIDTAAICVASFDRAVSLVGTNLEQASRNMIVDQINCFTNPQSCQRKNSL